MERKIYQLIVILLFCLAAEYVLGNHKEGIYRAFIKGDMESWKIIIDQMHEHEKPSESFHLEHINYHYGYIAWCLGNEKKELAEKYLDLALILHNIQTLA